MMTHIHLYTQFHASQDLFAQYINTLGPMNPTDTSAWATDTEIFFMAHLLRTPIKVFTSRPPIGWHLFDPTTFDSTVVVGDHPSPIYLVNTNGDHFDLAVGQLRPHQGLLLDNTDAPEHPVAEQPAQKQGSTSKPPSDPEVWASIKALPSAKPPPTNTLHVGVFNTRGLINTNLNKLEYIHNSVHNPETHVLCLTETWLQEACHLPSELSNALTHHCVPHRADRDLTRAAMGEDGTKMSNGGCLNVSTGSAPSEKLEHFSNGDVEVVISRIGIFDLYIVNIYRPPSATLAHFTEVLGKVSPILAAATSSNSNILMVGDFNFPKPNFDWEEHEGVTIPRYNPDLTSQDHLAFDELMKLVNRNNMTQVVNCATREHNILDLAFTNDPDSILDVLVSPVPSHISDHNFINITTSYSPVPPPPPPPPPSPPELATFDFAKADQQALLAELQKIDWESSVVPTMSTEDMLQVITDLTIKAATNAGVPKKIQGPTGPRKPKQIKKLWRNRCLLHRKLAANPQQRENILPTLEQVEAEIQSYYATRDDNAEHKAAEALKGDPSTFFSYVNSKRKERSHIGPLKVTRDGTPHYIYDPKRMADILSAQYQSVFFSSDLPANIDSLVDINFSAEDVMDALLDLKPTAASGPRGWSAHLLYHHRKIYAAPLYTLWRKSLDTGEMPEGINMAFVSPIFKGGGKSEPVNYRPIALTSHLTKTFERILRLKMVEHLAMNDLLNKSQHGFTARRSTMTQLIAYYTFILDSMINSKQLRLSISVIMES